MPRTHHRLSPTFIKLAKKGAAKPGRYSDGGNLALRVGQEAQLAGRSNMSVPASEGSWGWGLSVSLDWWTPGRKPRHSGRTWRRA